MSVADVVLAAAHGLDEAVLRLALSASRHPGRGVERVLELDGLRRSPELGVMSWFEVLRWESVGLWDGPCPETVLREWRERVGPLASAWAVTGHSLEEAVTAVGGSGGRPPVGVLLELMRTVGPHEVRVRQDFLGGGGGPGRA